MYHLVDDSIRTAMSVPREKFVAQMAWLKAADVTMLTQGDVNAILDGTASPPKNGVFLTFDDGYRNTVTDVLPILAKYDLPATIAVCSSYLLPRFKPLVTIHHSQDFASAKELKKWQKSGRDIAGHTYDHPWLTRITAAEAHTQIAADKLILSDMFEREFDTFLYPFGDIDDAVVKIAKKLYPTAFSISKGTLPSRRSRHRITRVFVDPKWSQKTFERRIRAELAKVAA